jgi:hypothetical protein
MQTNLQECDGRFWEGSGIQIVHSNIFKSLNIEKNIYYKLHIAIYKIHEEKLSFFFGPFMDWANA